MPDLSNRAGLPATTAPAGTSFVTTLPAPTVAPSPIVTPQKIVAFEPMEAPRFTSVRMHLPVRFSLQRAVRGGGPRKSIVDERHAMADEDFVFDRHAFADKRVTGNFAAASRSAPPFEFPRKRQFSDSSPNCATVKIRERKDLDPLAKLDVLAQSVGKAVPGCSREADGRAGRDRSERMSHGHCRCRCPLPVADSLAAGRC